MAGFVYLARNAFRFLQKDYGFTIKSHSQGQVSAQITYLTLLKTFDCGRL
jgi:hypothetical protein